MIPMRSTGCRLGSEAALSVVDERHVRARIKATDASRAQFLGIAFAITFLVAGLGDFAAMDNLDNHGFMLCQLLLSLAVVVVVRFTRAGREHAAMVFAGGMSAVSAAGAAHLAQFGGFDGPWFYGSYTAPPVMIPMLFSLRARVLWTFTTVASFVFVYWLGIPTLFTHPMAHVPLTYLLTISGISIGLGHYVLRLEVGSFVDVARLEAAAMVLEAQLRAGEETPARLRKEIARQLHDDVAQLLTGARIHLDGWSRNKAKDDAARRLAELLDELAHRSRRMLEELRAPPVRGPLVLELERLRDEYRTLGLRVDLVIDDDAGAAVDAACADVLVGSVREALTNALRHGGASEATVALRVDDDAVALDVLDNGGAAEATAVSSKGVRAVRSEAKKPSGGEGFGLLGIRERAAAVGGDVVVGAYEEGVRLTVTVPRRAA